jgi:glycosyltransferase involved in cell wall biosynthesis
MQVDVLMLSAAHPPDDVRILRKQGAALAAAGWRVMHLCPAAPDAPAEMAGVAITTYPRRPGWWGRIRNIPRLAALARRIRPRAIMAHEPDAWLAALLARASSRVVLDVHEHYPSRLDKRLAPPLRPVARGMLRLACRAMARRADAMVVAKDGLAPDYRRDCLPVRNYAEAPSTPPRRHAPGPLRLLHLGALSRARGWPQMLAALALAPWNSELIIAGRFTDASEADFFAEATRLGLRSRISFRGWLPPAEMAQLAACADINLVLFQPGDENHRLALPHKLADGMLAGLPVIAPAFATELAAIVREAGCGLLVDVTNPAAIAAAITALADPAARAAMGGAGRAAALGRFAWAGQAEALCALYTKLLGSAARPAL